MIAMILNDVNDVGVELGWTGFLREFEDGCWLFGFASLKGG